MGTILKYGAIFIGVFMSMVLAAAFTLGSCSAELMPKALAADIQQVVEDVKASSSDTFGEIQRNIDLVAELKAEVQEAQINGRAVSLDSVIKDIETVTQSYEKLAGQRDDIRKGLLTKIKKVEDMMAMVDSEVKSLQQKRADYSDQLRLVADPDPEIVRTRKEALTRAVNYVSQQIELWQAFGSIQGDIVSELSGVEQRIDSFLSMIESTAIVFREGLNLLTLQRDLNEALSLFTSDLPRIEELTSSMEKSWDTLDFLVNSLTGVASIGIK